MSRLDDELRKAFRREQPSADFTERLLKQVANLPEPKMRWWQRLGTLLEPPKLRWVAIGVAASVLLAIGAAQYRNLNKTVVVSDPNTVADAKSAEGYEKVETPVPNPGRDNVVPKRPSSTAKDTPKRGPRPTNRRIEPTRNREERELRAEGQAAKETLMLALSIASSALSDAQKAVHDDGLKP